MDEEWEAEGVKRSRDALCRCHVNAALIDAPLLIVHNGSGGGKVERRVGGWEVG